MTRWGILSTARIAQRIIDAARRADASTLPEQLDYALRLVAWSWIARRSGVQIALIDVLMDGGARPTGTITHDALINNNVEAASRLVERGATLSLATALCLGRWDDAHRLANNASPADRQVALALAALRGRAEALRRLLAMGVDLDAYSTDIYSHATAIHHAVSSGSLEAVKVLVEAGADLGKRDTAWNATPLEWAEWYIENAKDEKADLAFAAIRDYLRAQPGAVATR
jgi:peptide-methionine (S)-S-oxide reductase